MTSAPSPVRPSAPVPSVRFRELAAVTVSKKLPKTLAGWLGGVEWSGVGWGRGRLVDEGLLAEELLEHDRNAVGGVGRSNFVG